MGEVYFVAAIIAGIGYLARRHVKRRHNAEMLGERRGMDLAPNGLRALPEALASALKESVLFRVGDGGHERYVLTGEVEIADTTRFAALFELQLQRAVRGEWGYLDTRPPFRIFSPVTVVAMALPQARAPLLIKRRGGAEQIAEFGFDRYKSAVDVARDLSSIDRSVAVTPPPGLPREPSRLGELDQDYLLWAAKPEEARELIGATTTDYLLSPAVGGYELVIELRQGLFLLYCARDGAFTERDADILRGVAVELVNRMMSDMRRAAAPRS